MKFLFKWVFYKKNLVLWYRVPLAAIEICYSFQHHVFNCFCLGSPIVETVLKTGATNETARLARSCWVLFRIIPSTSQHSSNLNGSICRDATLLSIAVFSRLRCRNMLLTTNKFHKWKQTRWQPIWKEIMTMFRNSNIRKTSKTRSAQNIFGRAVVQAVERWHRDHWIIGSTPGSAVLTCWPIN